MTYSWDACFRLSYDVTQRTAVQPMQDILDMSESTVPKQNNAGPSAMLNTPLKSCTPQQDLHTRRPLLAGHLLCAWRLVQVRGGKLATAEGVSYLEAKHLLLLHYCINIVFYLLLKAEGRPVRDHPVIARLLELRAYLEKIRPIDKKLQYQMEKLLMVAQLQVTSRLAPITRRLHPPPPSSMYGSVVMNRVVSYSCVKVSACNRCYASEIVAILVRRQN